MRALLIFIIALLLAGCPLDSPSPNQTPQPPQVYRLDLVIGKTTEEYVTSRVPIDRVTSSGVTSMQHVYMYPSNNVIDIYLTNKNGITSHFVKDLRMIRFPERMTFMFYQGRLMNFSM